MVLSRVPLVFIGGFGLLFGASWLVSMLIAESGGGIWSKWGIRWKAPSARGFCHKNVYCDRPLLSFGALLHPLRLVCWNHALCTRKTPKEIAKLLTPNRSKKTVPTAGWRSYELCLVSRGSSKRCQRVFHEEVRRSPLCFFFRNDLLFLESSG